jgi:mRNA-degrading endonuclease toxin of MazEF toxin-antitoxin module
VAERFRYRHRQGSVENMTPWDIFLYPYPNPAQPHPVVIISNEVICSHPVLTQVNALACQTVRPITRPKKLNEVYLNSADGLELKTLVKCDFVLQVDKSLLLAPKGRVSPARISEIRRKLQEHF